jgi:hypothetical protein
MLAVADLLAVLDSIAAGVTVFEDALGLSDAANGTVVQAAASNRDALAAIADYTVQRDLVPTFARRVALVQPSVLYSQLQGAMLQRALDVHYGADSGSLNRFLEAEGARVHVNLNKIGFAIDARHVLPPLVDPVARYEGTGAGLGTFDAGSDVDTTKYGDAVMELVSEAMGAEDRTLRLTMTARDGSIDEIDIVVPAAFVGSSVIGGSRYIGVAGITTVAGGLAGDTFRVRTVVDRNLPAL